MGYIMNLISEIIIIYVKGEYLFMILSSVLQQVNISALCCTQQYKHFILCVGHEIWMHGNNNTYTLMTVS